MTKLLLSIIAVAGLSVVLPASQSFGDADKSVTVINAATNPAKTSSVDDPGRIPYQFTAKSPSGCSNSCPVTLPAVPIGKRLVIQHYSFRGVIDGSGGPGVLAILQALSASGTLTNTSSTVPPTFAAGGGLAFGFDQLTELYVDAGNTVVVNVFNNNVAFLQPVNYFVSGYLLDCNVNLCAPIAP